MTLPMTRKMWSSPDDALAGALLTRPVQLGKRWDAVLLNLYSEKDVKKYEQTEAAKSMCYSFYL